MKILCFGSLNIDHVYRVEHLARPGETLASSEYRVFAGGKGANQSAALALAGAAVFHAGQVGPEGGWLVAKLSGLGVEMRFTRTVEVPTGHAIIQVEASGQNSIVLFPGANQQVTPAWADQVIGHFSKGDILLLQNEINEIPHLIAQGRKQGLTVCLNPAPCGPEVAGYPLELVDLLVLNETEAAQLIGEARPQEQLARLNRRYPEAEILLTLGSQGSWYRIAGQVLHEPALPVEATDTTGAGDTFLGYFLASLAAGHAPTDRLKRATRAAALCVTRPGAMDSIPAAAEVDRPPPTGGLTSG